MFDLLVVAVLAVVLVALWPVLHAGLTVILLVLVVLALAAIMGRARVR